MLAEHHIECPVTYEFALEVYGVHHASREAPRFPARLKQLPDSGSRHQVVPALVCIGEAVSTIGQDGVRSVFDTRAAGRVFPNTPDKPESQWCYPKSIDGAYPIGPAIVHESQNSRCRLCVSQRRAVPRNKARGFTEICLLHTLELELTTPSDLEYPPQRSSPSVPGKRRRDQAPSSSQGRSDGSTYMLTCRTPAGRGRSTKPGVTLHRGYESRMSISHGVGTLIDKIEEEK
jgi:hypothetical protein